MDAKKSEDGEKNRRRRDHLHHADAEIAEAAVDTQRAALFRFGKEKTDISHAGSKVRTGKTAQQGNGDKYPEWSSGVLNGDTQPDTGHHQNNRA